MNIELSSENGQLFDLTINNAELKQLYKYNEDPSIPFVNELNRWVKQNILFWDVSKQDISFNFPESNSIQRNAPHSSNILSITPTKIVHKKGNRLFTLPVNDKQPNQRYPPNDFNINVDDQNGEIVQYQQVGDPFNSTQKRQIWNTGTFRIHYEDNSSEDWKIRPLVFYGMMNCYKFMKKFFQYSNYNLRQILNRFISESLIDIIFSTSKRSYKTIGYSRWCNCEITILDSIFILLSIPLHLFILIIGIPLYEVDTYQQQNEEFKAIETRIEQELTSANRTKYADTSFLRYASQNKDFFNQPQFTIHEDEELLNLVKLIDEGNLNIDVPENQNECIKQILQDSIYENIIQRVKIILINNNVEQTTITSFESNFRAVLAMYKLEQTTNLVKDPNSNIVRTALQQLQKLKCIKQHNILELVNNEFRRGITSAEQQQIQKEIRRPSSSNRVSIPRFIQYQVTIENRERIYSYIPSDTQTIESTYFGWKIVLFFTYMFSMIKMCIMFFLDCAIQSKFGLKAAVYSKAFYDTYCYNQDTGSLEEDHRSTQETITMWYEEIKADARQRIEDFDNEPDYGILGKSFTRIFNRLDNWVYRYFFKGFILVNIVVRLLCLIIGFFFLLMTPFSIIIAPIATIIVMILLLIFYDFTSPTQHGIWDLPAILPLFELIVWRILLKGLGQILLSIFLIIIHLIAAISSFLLALVLPLFRLILDSLVFINIYYQGKIPGGDSYLCWRSSRQGDDFQSIQLENYNTDTSCIILSNQQIYTLIDAHFDKQIIDVFKDAVHVKIYESVNENDSQLKVLARNMPPGFEVNEISKEYLHSAKILEGHLNQQVYSRKQKLPRLSSSANSQYSFAYKKEELIELVKATQQYLISNYANNGLFQTLMWTYMKCSPGNYEQLTLALLNEIFFNGSETPGHLLERLTYRDPEIQTQNANAQIDEFLKAKFNVKGELQQQLTFLPFHEFLTKITQSQSRDQKILMISSRDSYRLEEVILLNTSKFFNS